MVSYFGSVKSQLLIRDCNSKVETISIDLFSNGRNLQRVLRSQFGGELKNYSVRFGSKKVLCCKCATKCSLCLKVPSTLMCNFASFSMCFCRSSTLRMKIVTVLIANDAIRKRSLKQRLLKTVVLQYFDVTVIKTTSLPLGGKFNTLLACAHARLRCHTYFSYSCIIIKKEIIAY